MAQLQGDSLILEAAALQEKGDWGGAFAIMRRCMQDHPVAVRNSGYTWLAMDAFADDSAVVRNPYDIYRSIVQDLSDRKLVAANDLRIDTFLMRYPWHPEFLSLKRLKAQLQYGEGNQVAAIQAVQENIDECLMATHAPREGYWSARAMTGFYLGRGAYERALQYAHLMTGKLHEQRICSNDLGNWPWTSATLGLCYAGLGKSDSALKWLIPTALAEEPYSEAEPLRAIDSLIALLQRLDATPVLSQWEAAIHQASYTEKPCYHNQVLIWTTYTCKVRLAGQEIVFFKYDASPIRNGRVHCEWSHGVERELPYSLQTCQEMMRQLPFYLRLKGMGATEIFSSK